MTYPYFCLEMKAFNFNHLSFYNNDWIELLINELSESYLHFKIKPEKGYAITLEKETVNHY